MMGTTHAAAGVLLVSPLLWVAPEFATVGALAALVGGLFPDVDLFVGVHRRTLHFPVYYWVAAAAAGGVALVAPSTLTVGATCFLAAAGLHSGSDWFGAGEELRPWERTSEEAVYVHPLGRWLRPKRWIRYDGAPEDLLAFAVLAVPGIVLHDGPVRTLLVVALVVSVVYTAVRRRLPPAVQRIVR